MNLLLFQANEWKKPLGGEDPRVVHIRNILKSSPGDVLDAGIIDGPLGQAKITSIHEDGSCSFDFTATGESGALCPLNLIIGTPRPPTAKRLLRDLTAAGVSSICFTATDLGEKSYLTSRLWSKGEYKEAVLLGMAQGESTISPEIKKYYSLYKAIEESPGDYEKLALDNVSPDFPLKSFMADGNVTGVSLAIGPERGWSDRERGILREKGFKICSLGRRVLRTETAAHMGCALIQGALDFI